jgi:hypothetical protein
MDSKRDHCIDFCEELSHDDGDMSRWVCWISSAAFAFACRTVGVTTLIQAVCSWDLCVFFEAI